MTTILLFIFGMVFGSFGYVLALRYDGERFLLDPKVVGGRSYCPHCRKTLRWFELIPFVSFAIQGGQCRHCKKRIGFAYPVAELFSGLLFVAVAARVRDFYGVLGPNFWILSVLWIAFFFLLALLSVIDIRLGIIPDEMVIALCLLAVGIIGFAEMHFSFMGLYAGLFGLQENFWMNHVAGALAGILFFGGLVAVTRGKGMGMGDVKLMVPLGFLFGWPDTLFLAAVAFASGAVVGLGYVSMGKKTMKSSLPFGPFLVFAAVFIFLWGSGFLNWYFHAMGI